MPESQKRYEPSGEEFDQAEQNMSAVEAGLTEEREKELESQEVVTDNIIHSNLVIAPINGKLYRRFRTTKNFDNYTYNEPNRGPHEISKEEAEKDLDKAEEKYTSQIEYFTKQLENIRKAREILSKQG